MRIGYFGNPPISARLLEELLSNYSGDIVFVVSNPDKAQKRSKKALPTAVSALVKEAPEKNHQKTPLLLLKAQKLDDPAFIAQLKALETELFIVFAYGRILPPEILSLPSRGAINLHASLLPELRGASPIQNAILRDFKKTGWTLQYMNEKLDLGDIICQKELGILPDENAGELSERMLPEGIELVFEGLAKIEQSREKIKALRQNPKEGSYCKKIRKEDAQIQWQDPSQKIHNSIRAYNPAPLSWTLFHEKKLRIYRSKQIAKSAVQEKVWQELPPGTMGLSPNEKEFWVRTGDGFLSILELQLENRRRMLTKEFLNGYRNKL